jgi:hypothetical protein
VNVSPYARAARECLFGLALLLIPCTRLHAQAGGTISGVVTIQAGDLVLPGAEVVVARPGEPEPAGTAISDDSGGFELDGLAPGLYDVRVSKPGFNPVVRRDVVVVADATTELAIDLTLASIVESVSVEAVEQDAAQSATVGRELAADFLNVAPVSGDSFRAILPVLPGVLRGDDGRIRLNGGRPDQSGLQVGGASVTDPVTGDFGLELPTDAVETIQVISNPYLSEFGRFSSGIALLETRRGSNDWRFTANNPLPWPQFRGKSIQGIRNFSPRLLVGGPLVEDRLFLTQALQYEKRRIGLRSLPEDADDKQIERFNSFTRIDWQVAPVHQLVATVAVFPRTQRFVNLSTFVPEAVTPDIQELGHQTDLALNSMVLGGLVESRLTYRRYDVDVLPQEAGLMTITPLGTAGRHFNEQFRNSHSLQWLGSFSRGWTGRTGEHLIKGGLDVLHAQFTGRSSSRDVEVRDLDGTLRERVSFAGEARQSARATDVAAYLQDRWRPHDRLLVEYGVRLDRDGVMTTMNVSPRIGVSWSVWPDSRGVIRGGVGRFVQRTPLAVAAFEEFERRTVTVAGAGGEVTTTYTPELVASAAPQAYVASLEYNHRITPSWSFKASQVHRSGSREFLVDPQAADGRLILRGNGESRYVESEATLGYVDGRGRSLFLTYVYTDSTADYNNLDRYFGNLRQPLIRANTFTRTDVDVPHRVIARGTLPVPWRWQVVPLFEIREGFPYSVVDAGQNFVGRQNSGRFPVLATLDLAINREITVRKRRLRVGVRAFQVLNRFNPRDVQSNVDSGQLGAFFNSLERRLGVTFQILP